MTDIEPLIRLASATALAFTRHERSYDVITAMTGIQRIRSTHKRMFYYERLCRDVDFMLDTPEMQLRVGTNPVSRATRR